MLILDVYFSSCALAKFVSNLSQVLNFCISFVDFSLLTLRMEHFFGCLHYTSTLLPALIFFFKYDSIYQVRSPFLKHPIRERKATSVEVTCMQFLEKLCEHIHLFPTKTLNDLKELAKLYFTRPINVYLVDHILYLFDRVY